MISEAIESIKKLADLANKKEAPSLMTLDPNDPSRAYLWNPHTLKIEKQELNAAARKHTITTLASLAGAFHRYTTADKSSVWVTLTKVIVVIDDGEHPDLNPVDRRHSLTLPVTPSPLFDTLQKLPTAQKPLLNAVRHDLKPSKIQPENFEATISKLKWETTDTTVGEFGTVKSTMGRETNSEVKSGVDIPPEITVEFEPFPSLADILQTSVTVECSVVVDPGDKTVTVRPYPGQINLATCQAVEALRAKIVELLKADETTVFAGTP
jgi:hypothetical protein